jgi:hypothetical protein
MKLNLYERHLLAVRQEIHHHPTARILLDSAIEPDVLERFLIEWTSRAVHITRPVTDWIGRAAQRCLDMGLTSVGELLTGQTRHQEGDHLLFVEDARALVERWNRRFRPILDADALLARPPTAGMFGYIDLHERNITGPTPFAQVSIEYELEALFVNLLPPLRHNLERVLGKEVVHGLSFLDGHLELDFGHTAHLRRMLETLMQALPLADEALAAAGAAALRSYLQCLSECLDVARTQRPHATIDTQNIPRLIA